MKTVFVTGASGFIAKHIVKQLLEKGHQVKASVRSAKKQEELEALFPGQLTYAMLDLTKDDGWDEALSGCEALIHTASPFPLESPKDPQDLIVPAVEGTKRALRAAHQAGIKRVVLTSSNAAIYKDDAKMPEAPSTEDNWTTPDGPSTSAYEASKTLAERAAWEMAEELGLALTCINPALVVGPALDKHHGTSLNLVKRLVKGQDPLAPPMNIGVVDVRDVAKMHVEALSLEKTVGHRYSANAGMLSFLEMGQILNANIETSKAPKREAPFWLIKFLSFFMADLKTVVASHGLNLDVPGVRAEKDFDFTFIPPQDALIAAAKSLD